MLWSIFREVRSGLESKGLVTSEAIFHGLAALLEKGWRPPFEYAVVDRIETVADEADLDEVYNFQWQLLYVTCTRARNQLLATTGGEPSEFLADILP